MQLILLRKNQRNGGGLEDESIQYEKNLLFLISVMTMIACSESKQDVRKAVTLPFYNEATYTPNWMSPDDSKSKTFHRISLFKLTNQEGEIIAEKSFENKIYVVGFFFTHCPKICPKMTTNVMLLQDEFLKDDDVLLISHAVTPGIDSVSVLKRYADNRGIVSHKWHLLTRSKQEIYKLGRKDYFVEENLGMTKEKDEFLYTENFVLIDKNRQIRGIYNGLNNASQSDN